MGGLEGEGAVIVGGESEIVHPGLGGEGIAFHGCGGWELGVPGLVVLGVGF